MVTLDEALATCTAGASPKTVANYAPSLHRWAQLLLDTGTPWTEATPELIETHLDARRRAGASQGSRRADLTAIRALYRWGVRRGVIAKSPAEQVRSIPAAVRSAQRWLTREQARDILTRSREAERPVAVAVHLALLNGLRRGDIMGARGEHIRVLDGRVVLWLPERKGGRMDTVALPQPTVDLLRPPLRGPLVGVPYTTLNDHLEWLGASAGLDFPLRLHQLRATFVTLSLDAGVPPRDVMASAGHAHLETTGYYDRAYGSVRRNASGRLTTYILDEDLDD